MKERERTFGNLKIPIIAITFVLSLGLAMLGQQLLFQKTVSAPLQTTFAEIPGVSAVQLKDENGKTNVVLRLAGNQIDLSQVYTQVEQVARQRLGNRFGQVVLKDERTAALNEAFYRMHFALQQGIATGQFVEMARAVEQEAASLGLDHFRVYVGDRHVFVQLHQDDHSLYTVLPRTTSNAIVVSPIMNGKEDGV